MIRLRCPTGCAGTLRRPFGLRAEPLRCPNCRAWIAAPSRVEDGALVEAVVVAEPGAPLALAAPARRLGWWIAGAVALVLLTIAGVRILW